MRIPVTPFLLLLLGLAVFGCVAFRHESSQDSAARETKLRQLLATGNKLLKQGSWQSLDQAQAAYSLARELAPQDARAVDGLGCVAWRKGNIDLAEFYFRRACELSADYDRPIAHLALVAEARGHLNAAKELLQRAVKLNPLNFRARNNLAALALKGAGDADSLGEAHRELLRAYELAGPEDPIVVGNLDLLSRRKGW